MGKRKVTSIRLDEDLLEKAKESGFNISKISEKALKKALNDLENSETNKEPNNFPDNDFNPSEKNSEECGRRDLNPRRWLGKPDRPFLEKNVCEKTSIKEILEKFKDFCLIDLDLSESTFKRHEVCIKDLLKYFNGDISHLTKEDIRSYLKSKKENEAKSTYANRIKALRRFFRDFLEAKQLIEGFKLPQPNSNNNNKIPSKEDLQEFYSHIGGKKYRAAFLFLASSGLRTSEVTNLKVSNVDFDKRRVTPDMDMPKRIWIVTTKGTVRKCLYGIAVNVHSRIATSMRGPLTPRTDLLL